MSKLFWIMIFIAALALYVLVASRLIEAFIPEHIVLELVCYIVAGIVWIIPAKGAIQRINRIS